jgi:protein ImuB
LMEPLSTHLERRGRGAAVLHVRLRLVTREVHERSLQLPTPIRDARTLRTLALLDLESHPPSAAIDHVMVIIDPTPARVLQFSLLTRPLPSPELLSTLLARVSAVMGEGRCGSPVDVDSWRPGDFDMQPFAPSDNRTPNFTPPASQEDRCGSCGVGNGALPGVLVLPRSVAVDSVPLVALRRFRFPIPARVRTEAGKPVRVATDRRGFTGGRVEMCAGPWRTSGAWWVSQAWNRDEWDVMLHDGATYRLFRERDADAWFIEGIVD